MKRTSFLLAAPFAAFLLGGCPASGPSTNSTSAASGGTGTGNGSNALTVISPHNADIQTEFGELWKRSHPNVPIKWVNQGGSSTALLFVRQQFAARGGDKSKGIGVDVFFGGGGETFDELQTDQLLEPLPGKYGVPDQLNRVPLRSKENTWVAAALSGFGILYNKPISARDRLPVPKNWADLADPKLADRIELADPRQSGSAHVVYEIILQTNGWDKGWRILTGMAGNARKFVRSSTEVLEDVRNGEAVFCTAIDFYATNSTLR